MCFVPFIAEVYEPLNGTFLFILHTQLQLDLVCCIFSDVYRSNRWGSYRGITHPTEKMRLQAIHSIHRNGPKENLKGCQKRKCRLEYN